MAADRRNILWKPVSESDGNLVILFPYKPGNVVIRDGEGNIIARGRDTGPSNGYQATVRFDRPGSALNGVTVEDDSGRNFSVEDGGQRYENIPVSSNPGETTEVDPESGIDGTLPDTPGGDLPPDPFLVDPGIITTPDPISFPVIPGADFNFTDPIENTRKVGEFNREQSEQNFIKAMERARELNAEELASIQEFAAGMSDFQLELLDTENLFNAQQRLRAADIAIPGVQGLFARQRERAETLAGGRLLETSEDRALELAARSASAEGNVIRGFGDDSVVGRRTSDILTAQQRLGLQQIGEGFLAQSVGQAATILMDQPTKANIAARLPAQPAVPLSALVPQLQQNENALTTIDPATALNANINQEQFVSNLDQRTQEFNAQGVFQADQFNSNQMFSAILSRANIIAGNVAALNEFGREAFNVEESRRQFEAAQRQADQALATFRRNRDRNELFQNIGAIFGGILNVPKEIWDYIEDQTGIDLRPGTGSEDRPSQGGGGGGGSSRPDSGGQGRPPTGGESSGGNRPPQEDRDDGTGFEEDDEEDTFDDDEGGGGEDFEGDTEDDIIEDNEGSGIPKFAKGRRQREISKSGIKKRRLKLVFRKIDRAMKFNSGATLNINLRDDEDMQGVI